MPAGHQGRDECAGQQLLRLSLTPREVFPILLFCLGFKKISHVCVADSRGGTSLWRLRAVTGVWLCFSLVAIFGG